MKGDPRYTGDNYINWLQMVLNPLELTKDNLDDLIEYERGHRARYISDGTKPKKHQEGKPPIDLVKLGLMSSDTPFKRRR